MKTSRVLRIVFLSIVLGCVEPAFSQSSTGSISGTVTDQNNAVVLGAKVFGKNTETGFVRSTVTNSSGLYRLTDIPSGPYEITIEAAGFKKHTQSLITLDVGQSAMRAIALLRPDDADHLVGLGFPLAGGRVALARRSLRLKVSRSDFDIQRNQRRAPSRGSLRDAC